MSAFPALRQIRKLTDVGNAPEQMTNFWIRVDFPTRFGVQYTNTGASPGANWSWRYPGRHGSVAYLTMGYSNWVRHLLLNLPRRAASLRQRFHLKDFNIMGRSGVMNASTV
jgi:hypothetical protein